MPQLGLYDIKSGRRRAEGVGNDPNGSHGHGALSKRPSLPSENTLAVDTSVGFAGSSDDRLVNTKAPSERTISFSVVVESYQLGNLGFCEQSPRMIPCPLSGYGFAIG